MATYRKFRDIDYGKPIIAPTHGDTVAPQNDLAAAAWLPISRNTTNASNGYFTYDYQRHVFTDKVVIMPGKLVALTRESLTGENATSTINQGTVGRLVPAGIRLAWKAARVAWDGTTASGTDVVLLKYTTKDVNERVEDLTTGLPVAAPVEYKISAVTAGLKGRGLIGGAETCDAFISRPIGVAANVVYAWAGGDGTQPNKLRFMNYRRENKSTFWTGQDHTFRLPVAPVKEATLTTLGSTYKISTLNELQSPEYPQWLLGSEMASVLKALLPARYGDVTNADWVALAFGRTNIEHNLYNPITYGSATLSAATLKAEKATPNGLKKPGDYFVDRDLGILFMHEPGGNTFPASGTVVKFGYSPTAAAAIAGVDVTDPDADTDDTLVDVAVFAGVSGNVKPGDYLAYDKYSNFVPYVARPDETGLAADGPPTGDSSIGPLTVYVNPALYHRPEDIVGKCYTLDRSPKADLATVKTFHDYDGVSLADRTPGSANDGHPAEIHQSTGGQFAAIVRVLL
jgi:hypothetical protein